MALLDKPAAPGTVDVRVTLLSGRVIGLTYMHEGFAPTVPCTKDGCYMVANALLYEIGTSGRLYRFCNEHMPKSVLKYVHDVLGIQTLGDDGDA